MESVSVFIKRFLAFLVGPIVAAGISFVIVPLATWMVSPEEFGKASMYTLAMSLLSLIIYLGFDHAFVREFYDTENKRHLFMNSISLPINLSLLCSFLGLIFWRDISLWLYGRSEWLASLCLVLAFPFTIVERFNLLAIRMEEKAKLYSRLMILRQAIRAPFLLCGVYYVRSFVGIVLAEAISQIVFSLFSVLVSRVYWTIHFNIDCTLLKKLLKYGLPFLPASFLMWLFNGMDKIALRYWSSFDEIGLYAAAFKVVSVLLIFNGAFCAFWAPTAFRWYEEKVPVEKFDKVGEFLCFFMTAIGFLLIAFRKYIILILSSSYQRAADVMPFLIFIPVMYTISEVTVVGINFMKRTELHIISALASFVTNFIGNYLLVPILGAQGAAISTGISYIVFFWCRTLSSMYVWKPIKIRCYFINILLLFSFIVFTVLNSFFVKEGVFIVWLFYNRKTINSIMLYVVLFFKNRKLKIS
ncbi:lipopolysaccharide biosynthesis protein [Aminobacterium colombiense]|uniref:Polysaccharide biosynthesis protein n=1 Tax=Aminobacterium colombiense (strain DSM 12261 / ALA-1) TaxID=572547 RepID=D5EH12_AMICL|nr:oligosaccharide flippase family protein [Aminobacterium colombiense]ADE57844.1 polysaccharide biosynthesis protein [Aminobacterium colombiense DSM 12261]